MPSTVGLTVGWGPVPGKERCMVLIEVEQAVPLGEELTFSPEAARQLAASLLRAADHAEAGNG